MQNEALAVGMWYFGKYSSNENTLCKHTHTPIYITNIYIRFSSTNLFNDKQFHQIPQKPL